MLVESAGWLLLAVLFLFWKDPAAPMLLYLLPPFGSVLCAIEPLLSKRTSTRKRLALAMCGTGAVLSSSFYLAFVMPSLMHWIQCVLAIFMISFFIFPRKCSDNVK